MPFEESKDYVGEGLRNNIFNYEINYDLLNSLNERYDDCRYDINIPKFSAVLNERNNVMNFNNEMNDSISRQSGATSNLHHDPVSNPRGIIVHPDVSLSII